MMLRTYRAAVLGLSLLALPLFGQEPVKKGSEYIEVTATKIAEDVTEVPAAITVIDGDDIRARNATDLASALGFVAGVSVAPGGDGGPAGSVPEMWGLREFDAFLLVVDGVPWGGAFNPDLPTLDLTNVDRIEVLRGSAPVMYGATSFVGVIHVIHRAAGAPGATARLSGGNYSSGGAAISLPISSSTSWAQSISASFDSKGFRPERSGYDAAHVLYRSSSQLGGGTLHFDLDGAMLRQDPYSPHLRQGRKLSTVTPLDANYNPRNARIDENRYQATLTWDSKLLSSPWTTTFSVGRSDYDIVRGFLGEEFDSPEENAVGFLQDRKVDDVYFDTHLAATISPALRAIVGVDFLHGKATAESGLFEYHVDLSGANAPRVGEEDVDEETRVEDTRNFAGAYVSTEWTPLQRLRFDLGLRLNRTSEERLGEAEGMEDDDEEGGEDDLTETKLSGSFGVNWQAWREGADALAFFADYRDTYKPAAIDFGPEAEGEILDPETATSVEVGAKGRLLDGRLSWQTSAFQMDFENLVVSAMVNGLPGLENAGNERFRGGELELDYAIRPELRWELGYSYHDARFRDYTRLFDGVPTQLSGRRLEMSPFHLAGVGLLYAPASGLNGNVQVNYVGERYMDKRNRALADAYTAWNAGVGYRFGRHELRVDGRNLGDTRPPVAESELGDAQYYRLPARSYEASYRLNF